MFISPYPEFQHLQHTPTVVMLVAICVADWRGWLGGVSTGCLCIFLWLHILGATWIYSFVPYDEWAIALTATSLSDAFGWQRNHYDRLVHFASGFLLVAPASELLQRTTGIGSRDAAIQAVAWVLAIGALYEIAEWQIAVLMSPEAAEAYNGQQGDIWDPQADMAWAALGSCIAAAMFRNWSVGNKAQSFSCDLTAWPQLTVLPFPTPISLSPYSDTRTGETPEYEPEWGQDQWPRYRVGPPEMPCFERAPPATANCRGAISSRRSATRARSQWMIRPRRFASIEPA